jgi:membrane fusion protein, heavy metal efflux system
MKSGLKRIVIGTVVLAACGATALVMWPRWRCWLDQVRAVSHPAASEAEEHAGHDHGSGEEKPVVKLSDQARTNLGLELMEVDLVDHWRMASVPAEVIEEPGHCEQGVPATVQGVVLKIHVFLGQTVRAGDPLFDMRVTSELLASAQSSLLKTMQDRELIDIEIARLTKAVDGEALPRARLIEKESDRKRLESQRLVQIQELLVRGLTPAQIDHIVTTKTLLRELTVRVPVPTPPLVGESPDPADQTRSSEAHTEASHPAQARSEESVSAGIHQHSSSFTVEKIDVHLGKLVTPGDELMHLARHEQLMIEGRAFESDVSAIQRVLTEGWSVTALFPMGNAVPLERAGLRILYVDNVIDEQSHSVHFYVPLKNEVVRDNPGTNGLSYRTWQFKPGQAARLMLRTERLSQRIVLPAEAVVREGADAFVFRVNGKLLERVAVVVEHLDSRTAVLKNDGTLTPGFDLVAKNNAYQLNLELKKRQSGGGGGHDHAGHSHEH